MAAHYTCGKCGIKMTLQESVQVLKCPICRLPMDLVATDEKKQEHSPQDDNKLKPHKNFDANESAETQIVGATVPGRRPGRSTAGLKVARPVRIIGENGHATRPEEETRADETVGVPHAGTFQQQQDWNDEYNRIIEKARKQAENEAENLRQAALLQAQEEAQALKKELQEQARTESEQILAEAQQKAARQLESARQEAEMEAEQVRQQTEQDLIAEVQRLATETTEAAEQEAQRIRTEAENDAAAAKEAVLQEAAAVATKLRCEAEAETIEIKQALQQEAEKLGREIRTRAEEEAGAVRKQAREDVEAAWQQARAEMEQRKTAAAQEAEESRQKIQKEALAEADTKAVEIRANAQADAEKITADAHQKAESILQEAQQQAETKAAEMRERALAQAAAEAEKIKQDAVAETEAKRKTEADAAVQLQNIEQPAQPEKQETAVKEEVKPSGEPARASTEDQLQARKVQIAKEAKQEARKLQWTGVVTIILFAYFAYLLAYVPQLGATMKVLTSVLLLANVIVFGRTVWVVLTYRNKGRKAVVEGKQRNQSRTSTPDTGMNNATAAVSGRRAKSAAAGEKTASASRDHALRKAARQFSKGRGDNEEKTEEDKQEAAPAEMEKAEKNNTAVDAAAADKSVVEETEKVKEPAGEAKKTAASRGANTDKKSDDTSKA